MKIPTETDTKSGLRVLIPEEALASTGGSRELLGEVARLFIEDAEKLMLSIRAAIDRLDGKELARATHNLRGGAASLGAEMLCAILQSLEDMGRSGELANAQTVWEDLVRGLAELEEGLLSLTQSA